jgi:hypothetical protein
MHEQAIVQYYGSIWCGSPPRATSAPEQAKSHQTRSHEEKLLLCLMRSQSHFGPVRLSLSARIIQPFNNIFLLQQISISINSSRRTDPSNRALVSGAGAPKTDSVCRTLAPAAKHIARSHTKHIIYGYSILLHSWYSKKAFQTRCPSIISYNFFFQLFSSIFSYSAMTRALEDHVHPEKNLRQDCHGRKPPAEEKKINFCHIFHMHMPLGARSSEFVIPKLKWHWSILLTTPLASNIIIFLHYKTRASTDFAFLLCELNNQERNDHE